MKIAKIKDLDTHSFVIKWRCTYACNYSCSYCYQNEKCNKNFDEEFNLLETAKEIKELISRNNLTDVELMMIGGEVSLLDLHSVMKVIDNVSLLHITTNLSQSAEWYNSLNEIVPVEVCASFHHEYVNADDFIEKVQQLKCAAEVEAVYNEQTAEQTERLIELCKEHNIHYQIDHDRLNDNASKIYESNKLYPRLEVIFDDGTVKQYNNKNDIFTDENIKGIKESKWLPLKNKKCSWGSDYLYIKGNIAYPKCGAKCSLKEYKPQNNVCEADYCSFCGRLNIK